MLTAVPIAVHTILSAHDMIKHIAVINRRIAVIRSSYLSNEGNIDRIGEDLMMMATALLSKDPTDSPRKFDGSAVCETRLFNRFELNIRHRVTISCSPRSIGSLSPSKYSALIKNSSTRCLGTLPFRILPCACRSRQEWTV